MAILKSSALLFLRTFMPALFLSFLPHTLKHQAPKSSEKGFVPTTLKQYSLSYTMKNNSSFK